MPKRSPRQRAQSAMNGALGGRPLDGASDDTGVSGVPMARARAKLRREQADARRAEAEANRVEGLSMLRTEHEAILCRAAAALRTVCNRSHTLVEQLGLPPDQAAVLVPHARRLGELCRLALARTLIDCDAGQAPDQSTAPPPATQESQP